MAIPTWPSTLPLQPLVDGYEETWFSQTEFKTPDSGAPIVRRKQALSMRAFKVKFVLTEEQVNILDNFIYKTLEGGALRFEFIHPRTKESVEMSFYGKDTSTELVTISEPKGRRLPKDSETKEYPKTVFYTASFTMILWP
ncbi:MAG: hypothetical protein IKW35_07740 [Paludibacteraceae bacterium]|nr:hypothetical protein [Paludibacteraceae bacterium]